MWATRILAALPSMKHLSVVTRSKARSLTTLTSIPFSVAADNSTDGRNMVLWIAESATGPRKPLYVDSGMKELRWPASPFPDNNVESYYMDNVTAYFVATPTLLGATTYYISTPAFKTFDSSSNNYKLAKLANVSGVTFQKNPTLPGAVMAEWRFLNALTERAVDIKEIISLAPVQVILSMSIKDTTYYLNASNPGAQRGVVGLSASNSTTFFVQYMT